MNNELGFNYRLTDLQAALGLSQLNRLETIVAERQRLYEVYRETPLITSEFAEIPKNVGSSVHLAVIRLHDHNSDHHRRVFEGLREANIGVQVHYTPVHLQPYYRRLGFSEGDFPEAELYGHNAISLPLYPGLKESDQDRVVKVLSNLLG